MVSETTAVIPKRINGFSNSMLAKSKLVKVGQRYVFEVIVCVLYLSTLYISLPA